MTANTKKRTRAELAEALVYPVTLTPAQKKEAAGRLAAARKKAQEKMNDEDKLALQLLQLKFQEQDYIEKKIK